MLDTKKILAKKIYSGLWFVLTQIDAKYLKQAVFEAKKQLNITDSIIKLDNPSLKTRLLILGLRMPREISIKFISALRFSLNILSSQRRKKKK